MKKLLKITSILLLAFTLFSCDQAPEEDTPVTTVFDMSEIRSDFWLTLCPHGGLGFSVFQDEGIKITDLFKGRGIKKNDTLILRWKGKSSIDIKNLYISIPDVNNET